MSEEAGRLVVRGAQATGLGFLARLAARLLFLFIAGRLFGAAAFGAYALALAAIELAVSVAGLGTKKTIFQLLDRAGERPAGHVLLDAAAAVAAAGLLLGAAIGLLALALPPSLLAPATAAALLLLAPAVAGQALLDLFLAATRWHRAIRYDVVARGVVEPWALLAGCVGAWLAGWRVEGLAIGYWCGTLAALVYAAAGARTCFGGFGLRRYRLRAAALATIVRGSAANTATDFLNALYTRIDLALVGLLLGEAPAGIYGMARQLAAPLRQIRQSFDGLLIPMVARSLAIRGAGATGEALGSAIRFVLVLQLPLLLILFAAGAALLEWVGPAFAAGYWALLALAAAETIQASFSIGDLVFVYLRPRLGLWLTLVSIAAGAASALLLIPALGITGAGLSVLFAYVLRAWLRGRVLRARFEFAVPRGHHAGPAAAALLGAAAALAAGWGNGPLLPLGAALAVYGAAILLWLKLSRQRLALSGFAAG